jgi:four helix bundle protein
VIAEDVVSHRYKDLIAWQKAKTLATEVYRATERFPKNEMYGLTSQLRRAAVSVASNIAEGQGRLTKGEFCHFLGQARGSLLELETQLAIALDLHFVNEDEFKKLEEQSSEVQRLLSGLIGSMRLRNTGSD